MGEITDYILLYLEESENIKDKVDEIAINLQNNIKQETPYDQGRLKRSIRVDTRMYKGLAGIITGYWDEGLAPHGIFVLAGTKPHKIRPKYKGIVAGGLSHNIGGRALYWKGAKHPVSVVNHPGTKPNDFLGRGLEKTLEAYR